VGARQSPPARRSPCPAAWTCGRAAWPSSARMAVPPSGRRTGPGPWPAGALRLADLGYGRLDAWQARAQQDVCGLSRRLRQTAVSDAAGDCQALRACLEASPTDPVEPQGTRGIDQRVPARPTPWRRAAAQNKGRQVSAGRLARAAWTVLVTKVPAAPLTLGFWSGAGPIPTAACRQRPRLCSSMPCTSRAPLPVSSDGRQPS
jgi:hypothetical protein